MSVLTAEQKQEITLAAGVLADRCGSADRGYRLITEHKDAFDVGDAKVWMNYVNDVREAVARFDRAMAPVK
jgi:hypothetical protein